MIEIEPKKYILIAAFLSLFCNMQSVFAVININVYDDFGRLTEVYYADKYISYSYDDMGNRMSVTVLSGGLDINMELGINIDVEPDDQIIGNAIAYNIDVSNDSLITATTLTLAINVDDSLNFISSTHGAWNCTGTNPVSCTLSALTAETISSLSFVYRPTQTGEVTASVSIDSAQTDINPTNNDDEITSYIHLSGIAGDSDGDGLPDAWEIRYGMDPFDASGTDNDPDADGLTNLEEYLARTYPNNPDSDADGLNDSIDDNPTLNPALIPIFMMLAD